ncbi:hypothetical protein [Sphingomonas sp. M1-B02]|uniref:hypothetical protein n=1 Tax=Sphingomonas sp. M1-B02 TaxID=3114300 RepID=UPI0022400EC3|nr:hypothetical protein [Sphingomonas sp. S6-11]UZK67627.1 hypothetical protein OKW87_07310 [Sphingomonas sp. S6-11]
MTDEEKLARKRYYMMAGVNLLATAGAVLGLVIAGRSQTTEYTVLGCAVILSSLYMMAVVPRALARRWRTPTP